MSDLVAFLKVRLEEDAWIADGAARDHGANWEAEVTFPAHGSDSTDDHIARHDPARVLADVDAKRRIIDEHFGFLHPGGDPDRACRRCSDRRADADPLIHLERWLKLEPAPCRTLRLLALPYAAHPDYQQAWRP